MLKTTARLLLALVLPASPLAADVFVVDDDGTAPFSDIQEAIDAVLPGDALLIRPGNYSAFVMNKGVTLLGNPVIPPIVEGSFQISDVPVTQKAIVVDLVFQTGGQDVLVRDCDGLVLLESIVLEHLHSRGINIEGCRDVRLHRLADVFVEVDSSRLEVVQSDLRGATPSPDGGPGVLLNASRANLALTSVQGGDGTNTTSENCDGGFDSDPPAGDGGDGVLVDQGSYALIAGMPTDVIQGGEGGTGYSFECDGWPGSSLVAGFESSARVSGVTASFLPPQVEQPNPADPVLEVEGDFSVGGSVTFTVRGAPGLTARLFMGRTAIVAEDVGIALERLCTRDRAVDLQTLDAGGEEMVVQPLPGFLPQGFAFWAQAELVDVDGTVTRSNSVPVVLR